MKRTFWFSVFIGFALVLLGGFVFADRDDFGGRFQSLWDRFFHLQGQIDALSNQSKNVMCHANVSVTVDQTGSNNVTVLLGQGLQENRYDTFVEVDGISGESKEASSE